jgi:hypothetical protein
MLVPLTDSTHPYAAMMFDLIGLHQATQNRQATQRVRATVSRPKGLRGLVTRFRVGRRHAPLGNPA